MKRASSSGRVLIPKLPHAGFGERKAVSSASWRLPSLEWDWLQVVGAAEGRGDPGRASPRTGPPVPRN